MYPVPAIPIEITYEVIGNDIYLDMWIGITICIHKEWKNKNGQK